MYIIGISGKIGTGKNFLANSLMKELEARGYTTSEASFATPLKKELTDIIVFVREMKTKFSKKDSDIVRSVATMYRMFLEDAKTIYEFILPDLNDETFFIDGYSRTEGVRRALQFLGTDVRRKHDNDYWVKRFHETLQGEGFVFVTDVRFANEADSIKEHGGKILRLEPPVEVVNQRTIERDGVQYSNDAHEHVSETALDKYERFDMVITSSSFDAKSIVDFLLQK